MHFKVFVLFFVIIDIKILNINLSVYINFQTIGGSILADVIWSDIKPLFEVLEARVIFLTQGGFQ